MLSQTFSVVLVDTVWEWLYYSGWFVGVPMPILDPLILWHGLGIPLFELQERRHAMSLLRDNIECRTLYISTVNIFV